ncbi:MAG: ABC transporter substrate-binding protein [Armatimonadetes bacterium]|nr:ABC transporter substrate-binding protein [Armatimonadota bacterium]MDW8153126.1 ABC transporter substrate-binding protein [Armatimonadota bacterium]
MRERGGRAVLRMVGVVSLVGLLAWTTRAAEVPGTSTKSYGGVLRKIYAIPRSPVGVPWEIVGISVDAATPALEALVRVDKHGRVFPWLAERWTVLPDQNTILFRLRRGVKFHDGTDFHAQAAKWNLDRQIEARTIPVTSVEVADEYTIRVRLAEYNNIWPTIFGGSRALMISPTAFTRNGVEWARWNPVGTGPFQIVRYERDVQAIYRRFERYWQAGKPYLEGVEYLFLVNPETRKMAFLSGQANFLGATFQAAAELARESRDRYNGGSGHG